MVRSATCRDGEPRRWRAIFARVLAFALMLALIIPHVAVADTAATAAVTVSSDGSGNAGGTSPQADHCVCAHANCPCHVGAPVDARPSSVADTVTSAPVPLAVDPQLRPGPTGRPFEPPRA